MEGLQRSVGRDLKICDQRTVSPQVYCRDSLRVQDLQDMVCTCSRNTAKQQTFRWRADIQVEELAHGHLDHSALKWEVFPPMTLGLKTTRSLAITCVQTHNTVLGFVNSRYMAKG